MACLLPEMVVDVGSISVVFSKEPGHNGNGNERKATQHGTKRDSKDFRLSQSHQPIILPLVLQHLNARTRVASTDRSERWQINENMRV